ncbi:MAG: hypothetical protein U0869_13900 [Chloroflexota bacterium]
MRRPVAAALAPAILAVVALAPAGTAVAATGATPVLDQVACGDGPAFPVAALDGPQGAELAPDGAARGLSRAASTGEAGYVPRSGWIRVVDAPDHATFVTWLHLPRSAGGALLQVTLAPDPRRPDGSPHDRGWAIADAGFCWPHPVLPSGWTSRPWALVGAVTADATSVTLATDPAACAAPSGGQDDAQAVIVRTPEHIAIALAAPDTASSACVTADLGEPLAGRDLLQLDGSGGTPVQVAPAPEAPATPRPDQLTLPVDVQVSARPTAIVEARATADQLSSLPQLVPVTVIDTLEVTVRLEATEDLDLAGPPALCLVGPYSAPDDAGVIDRCWGSPDLGAALQAVLPGTEAGVTRLPAHQPVEVTATIARGDVRCDYPPGAWHLETVLTPRDAHGHGWTAIALPEVPLAVDAAGLAPTRELTRPETRYCGMTVVPGAATPAP